MIFPGGLLAAALVLASEYRPLILGAWLVCAVGCIAARFAGGFLSRPEQTIHRTLFETFIRPAVPLAACIAVAISLPAEQAKAFAVSLVAFFSIMLAIDRMMVVANLARKKSLTL